MTDSLINSWLGNMDRRTALAKLNKDQGTNYKANRFGEMINGKRPIPKKLLRYFLSDALGKILEDEGIKLSKSQLQRIINRLS